MATKISQREGRRLRKRVLELEQTLRNQTNRWRSEWAPGAINIETLTIPSESYAKISTARLLRHAVMVTVDRDNTIRFYADKL